MKPTKSPPRRPGSTSIGMMARVIALLLTLALFVHAAAPPAGAPIGNQATATYTDAGNNSRTATSNQVVTYVQQVANLDLQQTQTKLAAPGGQVYFTHTLTNTGNGTDSFNLSWAHTSGSFTLGTVGIFADLDGNGIPDNTTQITSTGPLAAGGVYKFVVVGTVAGNATGNSVGTITAATTLAGSTLAPVSNTDTVTVTLTDPVISITKEMSPLTGPAGSTGHMVTFTYQNTGNGIASNVVLTDLLPAGMVYAGPAYWSVNGATAVPTNGTPLTVSGKTITLTQTGQTFAATLASLAPTENGKISFAVNIASGIPAGILENTGAFTYQKPDESSPGTGIGTTNTISFVVTNSAGVTIASNYPGSPAHPAVAQGGIATFLNTVTNTGNAPDSFDITLEGTSGYPAGTQFTLYKADGNTPLVDTNSDGAGIPDTGLLARNASYVVVVKATLPAGVTATGPFSVTKRATSKNDPSMTATTADVLAGITANTVDLTNNTVVTSSAPFAPGQRPTPITDVIITNAASPGTSTVFTLVANNTSGVSDNYNISTVLPAGWNVVFRTAVDPTSAEITNTGLIAAGGNKTFFAHVTVPAGATPGLVNLDFKLTSPASGANDTIRDAVNVGTARKLSLVPNHTGQIFPGGTVLYSHTLTNNGNVNEGGSDSTIALIRGDSLGDWSSIIYSDSNGNGIIDGSDAPITNVSTALLPGGSMAIIVKVSAPPGAGIGVTDVTTITATTSGGSGTLPAVVSVTDTTTVISSDLVITKKQKNNVGDAYSASPIANAVPGSIIYYQLTVVNNGTADATAVTINDAIPAFTTYTAAPAAALVPTGTGTIVTPGEGGTGAVTFPVGTLAPGASATATFSVKIDSNTP